MNALPDELLRWSKENVRALLLGRIGRQRLPFGRLFAVGPCDPSAPRLRVPTFERRDPRARVEERARLAREEEVLAQVRQLALPATVGGGGRCLRAAGEVDLGGVDKDTCSGFFRGFLCLCRLDRRASDRCGCGFSLSTATGRCPGSCRRRRRRRRRSGLRLRGRSTVWHSRARRRVDLQARCRDRRAGWVDGRDDLSPVIKVFVRETMGEFDRAIFVRLLAVGDQLLLEPGGLDNGRSNARAHLVHVLRPRQHGRTGPENVRSSRMRVALQS